MDILPIFLSTYSISSSILTLDDPKDYKENAPKSIIKISLDNNLKEIYLCDNSFSGFVVGYKAAAKYDLQLNYGIKLTLCNDIQKKDDDSKLSESRINLWIKNSDGYKKLVKIFSKAATDGFFGKPRIDCETLAALWDESCLSLTIPFYSSFLHKNSLYQSNCLPHFNFTQPTFQREQNDLPFNYLIDAALEKYCEATKSPIINTQSIYYEKYKDFLYYLSFICLHNRSNLEKPRADHLASDNFCFEHYLNLKNS